MPRTIISRSHEVTEALPLNQGRYHCRRCELYGSLQDMFSDPGKRCFPHAELAGSGWLDEAETHQAA